MSQPSVAPRVLVSQCHLPDNPFGTLPLHQVKRRSTQISSVKSYIGSTGNKYAQIVNGQQVASQTARRHPSDGTDLFVELKRNRETDEEEITRSTGSQESNLGRNG